MYYGRLLGIVMLGKWRESRETGTLLLSVIFYFEFICSDGLYWFTNVTEISILHERLHSRFCGAKNYLFGCLLDFVYVFVISVCDCILIQNTDVLLYRYMLIHLALLLWILNVPHKRQWFRGSAAQTADGKIRERAPVYPSRPIPLLVRTWRLITLILILSASTLIVVLSVSSYTTCHIDGK